MSDQQQTDDNPETVGEAADSAPSEPADPVEATTEAAPAVVTYPDKAPATAARIVGAISQIVGDILASGSDVVLIAKAAEAQLVQAAENLEKHGVLSSTATAYRELGRAVVSFARSVEEPTLSADGGEPAQDDQDDDGSEDPEGIQEPEEEAPATPAAEGKA